MELPQSLHGQLQLLTFDRQRRRFNDDNRLVCLALRAAMLTDLYLAGHLEDRGGNPHRCGGARPDDPVLSTVLDQVGSQGKGVGPN